MSDADREPATPSATGRCGRSSSAPAAASPTSTSAACTRRTPRWRCATPATSTPAAARASRIWVVPAAAITASSPDEKDAFFDPAADKAYRHPTFYDDPGRGAAPVSRTDDRDARARDLRAAARRRRAGARPAARRVDRQRARSSRRTSRWPTSRLDLLGQARTLLTYAGEVEGAGRDRGRPRLPARRARVPQRAAGRAAATATSPSRSPGSCCFSTYQLALYERLQRRRPTTTLAGVAGQGGQGGRLPPRPRDPVGAAARRRHRRVAPADAGRPRADLAVRRRAVRRPTTLEQSLVADGVAVDAVGAARRRGTRYVDARARRGDADPTRRPRRRARRRPARRPHRAAGLPARRDAAPAPRAPGGDVVTHRRCSTVDEARAAAAAGARPRGAGADASPTSAPARRRGRRRRQRRRDHHADLLRLPGDGRRSAATSRPRCAPPASTDVEVRTVLSPAWTTDWMTDDGPAQAAGVRHRAAVPAHDVERTGRPVAVGALPAVRQRRTPASSAGSARPRASRCGCATPAASRSTTSRRSE